MSTRDEAKLLVDQGKPVAALELLLAVGVPCGSADRILSRWQGEKVHRELAAEKRQR